MYLIEIRKDGRFISIVSHCFDSEAAAKLWMEQNPMPGFTYHPYVVSIHSVETLTKNR